MLKNIFIIIVIIAVLSLFFAVILYLQKDPQSVNSSQSITLTPMPTISSDIQQTIENFYKNYQDCMTTPPSEAYGQVSTYCQTHTGLTSPNFFQNLTQGGVASAGADPILCAQNLPSSIKVDKLISQTPTSASIQVAESFGSITQSSTINLIQNSSWQIDNIICPKPN